jgi:hypothetical protein
MGTDLIVMELSTRQVILLHMLHLAPKATVITLVDQVTPFYPKANPPSQQSVRDQLKVLLAAGLVELAHKGKPRTYLRTPKSYLVLPTSSTTSSNPQHSQEEETEPGRGAG